MSLLGIRHAALRVKSIPNALRFYGEVFGFTTASADDDDWAMIAQGGTTLSLIQAPSGSASPNFTDGSHPPHLGIVADSVDEVDSTYARVMKWNTEVAQAPKFHRDGSYGFYLHDPDGNALECIFIPHQLQYEGRPSATQGLGIILFGHGSSDVRWRLPLERLLTKVRCNAPGADCAIAYLEFSEPSLPELIDTMASLGKKRLFIVPVFISSGGGHMQRDFPALVEAARQKHPTVEITALAPVGESAEALEAFVFAAISGIQHHR